MRKILLAFAGAVGGLACGCIAVLLLLHLRMVFGFELPSIFVLLAVAIPVSLVTGSLAPGFFGMFFLCPLSWFLSSEVSGAGHPSDGDETTTPDFIDNVAYMLGLLFLVVDTSFTLPWLVAVGIAGIAAFAVGARRQIS